MSDNAELDISPIQLPMILKESLEHIKTAEEHVQNFGRWLPRVVISSILTGIFGVLITVVCSSSASEAITVLILFGSTWGFMSLMAYLLMFPDSIRISPNKKISCKRIVNDYRSNAFRIIEVEVARYNASFIEALVESPSRTEKWQAQRAQERTRLQWVIDAAADMLQRDHLGSPNTQITPELTAQSQSLLTTMIEQIVDRRLRLAADREVALLEHHEE